MRARKGYAASLFIYVSNPYLDDLEMLAGMLAPI